MRHSSGQSDSSKDSMSRTTEGDKDVLDWGRPKRRKSEKQCVILDLILDQKGKK